MASTTVPRGAGLKNRAPSFIERLRGGDQIAYLITFVAAGTILVITVLLFFELIGSSGPARHRFGWAFLATSTWDPVHNQFGALPFIFGTVVTSILALIIAVPVGLASAIFLAELAPPKLSDALTFLIELLAAVPSVIYGVLGIFLLLPILDRLVPSIQSVLGFLPIFSGDFHGLSIFSASIVLAIMVVPFIISVSREVLLAVPLEQRESGLATGATKWEVTWKVVVPYALRGVYGSIFLSLARALGETMAVTMVIGNTPKIAASLFAPGYTIAAAIANEFTEATSDLYTSALIELGLVLFGVTIIINALARIMILTTSQGAD